MASVVGRFKYCYLWVTGLFAWATNLFDWSTGGLSLTEDNHDVTAGAGKSPSLGPPQCCFIRPSSGNAITTGHIILEVHVLSTCVVA